jgi:hypothetical protein
VWSTPVSKSPLFMMYAICSAFFAMLQIVALATVGTCV